jgi:C4-type Zn-finger protein
MNKDTIKREMTDYCCPLCDSQLVRIEGSTGMPNFGGITLMCPSLKCPAQEVMGHGKNEKNAYSIILSKYTGKRISVEDTEEELPKAPEAEEVL